MPEILPNTGLRRSRRLLPLMLAIAPAVALAQSAPAISTIVAISGSQLNNAPVPGSDGALYGTTSVATLVTGGLIYRASRDGASMRTIYQLKPVDGASPLGGLIRGSDGLLYGTTSFGAATELNTTGTVYRVAEDGSGFTVLWRFKAYTTTNALGQPVNEDGANPEAELIEGSDGALYGVARNGGTGGTGAIFRVSRDGTEFAVLHSFGAITSASGAAPVVNADGIAPVGSLVEAGDGYLYGTASGGGTNGSGTLFRVRLDGTGFEPLYAFAATTTTDLGAVVNADGATPAAGLTDGNDGRLYGVTTLGGTAGAGTVFAFDPVGAVFTTLHEFDGPGGARPTGELLLAANGLLYGTTAQGGTDSTGTATNFGTIFSIARDGTGFTSLSSFDGTSGSSPTGRLSQSDASTFVGIVSGGAKCGQGAIYQFSLTGATIQGLTSCGQNDSGGGSLGPLVLLLLGTFGLARRLREH
jgi:uncharacterized repeat protein (TIGR03803 family)